MFIFAAYDWICLMANTGACLDVFQENGVKYLSIFLDIY